jgi:lysophospholipase L1-like esterase
MNEMRHVHTILFLVAVTIFSYSCGPGSNVTMPAHAARPVDIPDNLYPPDTISIAGHSDWTKTNYPLRIKEFKSKPLQPRDIVFLGNSITQGGNWDSLLNNPAIKNRGISGDVTDGVLQRLGEIVYVKPTAVFIEIGINDLFNKALSPERTANNIIRIASMIHEQSRGTKVFVQTVFPTAYKDMVSRIKETNDRIAAYDHEKIYTIVETHSLFADDQDLVQKQYTKDGVHLNESGYARWADYLKKYFR